MVMRRWIGDRVVIGGPGGSPLPVQPRRPARASRPRRPHAVPAACGSCVSSLALAAALVVLRAGLALAAAGPPAEHVLAAPPAYAPLQPASSTATPRITLPTRTPTRGPAGTATARATATDAPFVVITDVPGAATAGVPGSVAPGGAARPGGSAATPLPPGVPADPGIAPPAVPGTGPTAPAGGASDGRRAGTGPPGAGGDGRPAVAPPAPDAGGGGPAADPRVRAVWATAGPPRQGQGLVARFTAGRPGPWGWWPFYGLLLAAFGWAVARAWRALRAAGDR